jgi:hypothetical protein
MLPPVLVPFDPDWVVPFAEGGFLRHVPVGLIRRTPNLTETRVGLQPRFRSSSRYTQASVLVAELSLGVDLCDEESALRHDIEFFEKNAHRRPADFAPGNR